MLLLDELSYLLSDWQRQYQLLEAPTWRRLKDRLFAGLAIRLRSSRRRYCYGAQCALKPVCQNVMVFAAFFCNSGLDGRAQGYAIASRAGADNRK